MIGVRYNPTCCIARYSSIASRELGSIAAIESPRCSPSACRPWLSWLTLASSSAVRDLPFVRVDDGDVARVLLRKAPEIVERHAVSPPKCGYWRKPSSLAAFSFKING